jgi:hypothetical protein
MPSWVVPIGAPERTPQLWLVKARRSFTKTYPSTPHYDPRAPDYHNCALSRRAEAPTSMRAPVRRPPARPGLHFHLLVTDLNFRRDDSRQPKGLYMVPERCFEALHEPQVLRVIAKEPAPHAGTASRLVVSSIKPGNRFSRNSIQGSFAQQRSKGAEAGFGSCVDGTLIFPSPNHSYAGLHASLRRGCKPRWR